MWDSVGDSGYGQHDAPWLGFYDFFNNVCGLKKQTERLEGLWVIAQNAGWFLPHENICWISERYNVCKLKGNMIHCESGPAIAYPDGFEIYALNGVRVPRWLILTSSKDLDPHLLLKEENVEVRREIVRKVGIERICQGLGARRIDKMGDYELLLLDMGDNRMRPYLKMKNPSLGVYHIEGVPPGITTCEQALNWRNQSDEMPVEIK